MKIVMSLNEEFSKYLNRDKKVPSYDSSRILYREFEKRGHDVYLVHPTEIIDVNKARGFKYLYKIEGNKLRKVNINAKADGDIFFVRSLGEDSSEDNSLKFMNSLYAIENQVGIMLNDAESTSYEYKQKQKTLDLPFIPSFEIRNEYDLEDLLAQGKKIIAKPNIGFKSSGIIYLDEIKDIKELSPEEIRNYSFEQFMPEQTEIRYVFLDNEVIMRRILEKGGNPGKETKINVYVDENYDKKQLKIVKKAMEMTGMFFGAVDFRQRYVLEINGSGTGTMSEDVEYIIYDINSEIVDKVEEKFNKK